MDYALRPRGRFTQGERDGQQRITNWINGVQGKDATAIPDVENTVTSTNYAIKGFFDAPLTTEQVVEEGKYKTKLFKKIVFRRCDS